METTKKFFTWNFYIYSVINLTHGHVVHETDDLSIAKIILNQCRTRQKTERFAIQQQHHIAKFI